MLENISEYQLLDEQYSDTLSVKVNEYLKRGWELYGLPNMLIREISSRDSMIFTQAVIKRNRTSV